MKSQTIGKSESCKTDINGEESYCVYYAAHGNNPSFPPGGLCYYNVIFAAYNQLALFRYKNAPENGEGQDSPKNAFPSAGFENLRIQASTDDRQGWPDAEGRYWWQLTLEDRSINRDFYWTKDKERGYPDKNDNNRYWFIIHGPNGIKIEGFSWEADREHGFPDRNGDYWRYVQYTECGPIKKWMQEKHLRYLARMGDVKAKFELAQRYHKGDKEIDLEKNIIEKDTAEAIVWYEKAAALGSVEAYLSLGDIYVDGDEQVVKDVSKAIGWYEKAADLKSIEAYLALGSIYADGDEKMTKDMRKAIGYYKKAADLKSAEAYLALGQIYANGDGDDDIPIDEKVAIDYFRKAAELGDEEALSELKNFADTRNREALCALECTAARHGPNKYKAQKYLQNSEGRHFFDPQRCAPEGEDDCVASPSIAIILGTTLGLIGLMVLILWWYKTPQTSEPDIREISEEDIETAIQNEDFAILNALLSDEDAKKDMRAWSFIGLDREELYLDDEGLLIRGIIFDKETLLQTTRNYLDGYKKNPDVNPLYLRRLFWGINRLLQTQRLSSKEILSWQAILNRLEDILEDELSVELETDGIPLLPFHRSHHDNSSRETKDNSEKSNSFLLTPSAFFALSSSPESATLMSNKGEKEDVVIQQTSRSLSAHELIKDSFLCPITQEIMFDPVIAMDGYTYEREAILEALHRSMLSPMTRQPIESSNIISNHNTRSMIREFLTQYPEYWQEVYVSKKAVNELLALSSGTVPLDLPKWEAILRADSRLLTLPLNSVTLLEFLCEQKELMVTTYLPALLNLLKPVDWQALIQVRSAEDWQVLVTQACERCSAPSLKAQFLHKLQSALEVQITPLENSLMHEKMVYKRA